MTGQRSVVYVSRAEERPPQNEGHGEVVSVSRVLFTLCVLRKKDVVNSVEMYPAHVE